MSDFNGRVILVTGGAGGIGSATCRMLASRGADVIAAGRNEEKLAALAAEIGCRTMVVDVTDEDAVAKALDPITVFGVVNNAGWGGELLSPTDMTVEYWDRIMDANAKSVMLVTKHTARNMISAGRGGSIVNVSSQASLIGLKGHLGYAASKGAVDSITRVSALELGPYNIRVNSIHPTAIMTDMSRDYWSRPEVQGPVLAAMPLGRWPTVDEVAGPIVFYLSDDSTAVTATSLPVDGGYTNV